MKFEKGSFSMDDFRQLVDVLQNARKPEHPILVDIVVEGCLVRMDAADAWNYLYDEHPNYRVQKIINKIKKLNAKK